MKTKLTFVLITFISLNLFSHADDVYIPDPNLRQAVRDALNAPITQVAMHGLTELYADDLGIVNLTGLESAVNLVVLSIFSLHSAPILGVYRIY